MITHILAYQYTQATILFVKAFKSEQSARKFIDSMGNELKGWTLERIEEFNHEMDDFDSEFIDCRLIS